MTNAVVKADSAIKLALCTIAAAPESRLGSCRGLASEVCCTSKTVCAPGTLLTVCLATGPFALALARPAQSADPSELMLQSKPTVAPSTML